VSHSKQSLDGVAVRDASQILELINDSTRVVAVDEVQFFDPAIVDVVGRLANRGHRVICAGLDLDYMGQPFGEMPKLLATADEVLKVQAICTVCGSPATRSFRIIDSADQILVGEQHQYEARCRLHFDYDSPFYPQGQKNILAPFDEAAEQAQ
jgi:thymidine kinase